MNQEASRNTARKPHSFQREVAHISVHPESKEEADRIFNALSAGGTIEMPISDQMWGDYYGSFEDKFGVQWMVIYTYPK